MRCWGWVGIAAMFAVAAADGPVVLHPGETTRLALSSARGAIATVEVVADRDETLTVEARSIDLDVKVAILPLADGAPLPATVDDDNGLAGTDAAAEVRVRAGGHYRIEVRPADPTEEAHGEVEIVARRGALPGRDDAARSAADEAYWTTVARTGATTNDPWLMVRGRLGMAKLHYERGAYADMTTDCREATTIATEAWGASDGRRAVAMAELGLARYLSGDLSGSREAVGAALPVLETRYGPDDERLATALNYQGLVEEDLGELRIARDAYERALGIRERRDGPSAPSIVAPLGNVAGLTDRLGDPDKALALYRRALAIVEGNAASDPLRKASLLNNVGFELKRLGRLRDAVASYERALAIRRAKLGDDHPSVAVCLQNLGVALHELGETDQAIPMLEQALAIREKRLGADHPDVAVTLGNLARVLHESGRSADALPMIDRALAIRTDKLGPAHPDTAQQRALRARVLAALGRNGEAVDEALAAEGLGRVDARRVARFLPETTAMQYAARRAAGLDIAIATVLPGNPSPVDVRRLWEATSRSRSLVLDEMARRARALRTAEDPAAQEARERVERSVGAWTRLVTGGSGLNGGALRTAVDAAARDLETSERSLAEVSASYRREVLSRDVTLADVVRAVPQGAWLVAFVRYQRAGRSPAPSYAAFVQPPRGEPRLVDLGAARAIDDSITAWRGAIAATGGDDVVAESAKEVVARGAGDAVRRAIWDPLRVAAGDASRVVVIPDGSIHLIPFAALPASGNAYVLETGPVFQYASAERDLLGPAGEAARGPMLAVGGPSFDGPPAPGGGAANRATRGRSLTACGDGPPLHFDPLPNAAREAADVAKLVGGPARVLVGANATETAFKKLAPGNGIVHLATHGFVLGDRCAASGQSPLRLAGLAFAGANAPTPAAPGDDGVLTAEEVAALDLSRADWVALSSCDSGGGTVARGEGVLGLRRAFTIAGARTLVLTLWPVDDRDARRWMSAAYRARFNDGVDPSDAARAASLQILLERRARGLDTSPAHWGTFVVTGR